MNWLVVDEYFQESEDEFEEQILEEKKQSKKDIIAQICQLQLGLDTIRQKRKDRHVQNTEGKNALFRFKDDDIFCRIISLLNSIREIHGKDAIHKLLSALLEQHTYAQDMRDLGNLISKKKNEIGVYKDILMAMEVEEREKKRRNEEIRRNEISKKKIEARIQRLMAKSRAKKQSKTKHLWINFWIITFGLSILKTKPSVPISISIFYH